MSSTIHTTRRHGMAFTFAVVLLAAVPAGAQTQGFATLSATRQQAGFRAATPRVPVVSRASATQGSRLSLPRRVINVLRRANGHDFRSAAHTQSVMGRTVARAGQEHVNGGLHATGAALLEDAADFHDQAAGNHEASGQNLRADRARAEAVRLRGVAAQARLTAGARVGGAQASAASAAPRADDRVLRGEAEQSAFRYESQSVQYASAARDFERAGNGRAAAVAYRRAAAASRREAGHRYVAEVHSFFGTHGGSREARERAGEFDRAAARLEREQRRASSR